MLILSRMAGETIIIGNNVRIQVLSNKNGQVRIGIDAPREIPVRREEIIGNTKSDQASSTGGEETEGKA